MRRPIFAVIVSAGMLVGTMIAQGQVAFAQAVQDSGTADTSPSTTWTVFDYNPSGHALAPRTSAGSMPATGSTAGGVADWQFDFVPGTYTALFTTTDPNLTGDLSTATLSDTITAGQPQSASGAFNSQNGGCDACASVRFYFTSPCASGPSDPAPGQPVNSQHSTGFYARFWWSNPVNVPLASPDVAGVITAQVSDPAEWSDWDGKPAADPLVTAEFQEATHCVQSIGLSFGGGFFFENGVTFAYAAGPPPYESFSSSFSES